MTRTSATQTIIGRGSQVDICPCEAGLILSVGRVSIWLERADVEDLVETLERALLLANAAEPADAARGRANRLPMCRVPTGRPDRA
jgi:hypothetical protein